MSEPLLPATEATAPGGPSAVMNDAPCRKCGYNLRGLPTTGRCPECATPVGLSVHGDLLRYSHPRWVRGLARGAKMIIAGVAVALLGGIAAGVLAAALGTIGAVAIVLVMVVAYGLSIAGSWLLTEPDPSGIGEDRYGRSRKIIRVSLIVGVASVILQLAETVAALPPEIMTIIQLLQFAATIVSVIGWIALLNYLKQLSQRIPDDALAKRAGELTVSLGGAYILFVTLSMIGQFISPRTPGSPVSSFACISGILGLVLLFLLVRFLLMLEKLGKRFAEQAKAAEATWAGVGVALPGAVS